MRFARVLCLFCMLCAVGRAHTQIASIYATLSVAHLSSLPTGSNCTQAGCTEQYRSLTTAGIGGGVTLRLVPLGLVDLGLDLRGSTKPGTPGAQTGLVGLKATFKPPVLRLRPYGQFSVGYFATSTPNVSNLSSGTTFGNNGLAYEVLGGLDVPVARVVDVRAVEIGAGQAFGLFNSKSSGLVTINTGVVLHF